MHRPDLWRDEVSGQLRPDVRDLYLGLVTLTDDGGFTLWRPASIGAALYPYEVPARRLRDLARRADALEVAGLVKRLQCGCAELPRMRRDCAQMGGDPTHVITEFHASHQSATDSYGALRSATASGSVSVSGFVSELVPVPDPRQTPAERTDTRNGHHDPSTEWGPAWAGFREAWRARGFAEPPTPKQREVLWDAVDARPRDSARWVGEPPPGTRSSDVVGHVLSRWHEVQANSRSAADDGQTRALEALQRRKADQP